MSEYGRVDYFGVEVQCDLGHWHVITTLSADPSADAAIAAARKLHPTAPLRAVVHFWMSDA